MSLNTFQWSEGYRMSQKQKEVTISLHEVTLGSVKPLHSVHELQVDLRFMKMIPHDQKHSV